MAQSPLPHRRRPRRFHYSTSNSQSMEVPRLSLDALSLARALAVAAAESLAQLRARPRVETAVKCSGGITAALLALKFAKSLRSACAVGLLAGVFAHSLYADVLRKKPAAITQQPASVPAAPSDVAVPNARRTKSATAARAPEDKEQEGDDGEEVALYDEADADKPRIQVQTATRARDN